MKSCQGLYQLLGQSWPQSSYQSSEEPVSLSGREQRGTRAPKEQICWAAKGDVAPILASPIPRHTMVLPLCLPPHPHCSSIQLSGSIALSREDTSQCKRKENNSHKDEKLHIIAREEVTRTLLSSSLLFSLSEALGICSHAMNTQQRRASLGHEFCPCTSFHCSNCSFPVQSIPGKSTDVHSLNLCEGNPSQGMKAFHSGQFVAGVIN